MKNLFFTLILIVSSIATWAQNGTIRGTVIDKDLNETIIGASVIIQGTTNGASTDLDGKFTLTVKPGTYNVEVSFIGLQKIIIEGVVVKENEVTVLPKIFMSEDSEVLGGVVITAEAIRNNEAAMQLIKKESTAMLDGVSAEKMEIAGAGSAADAAKNVTGVSVEGGKYVFVRGLGDRYTKTTLNGMVIPGLDPDKNTVQMDIFPSSIINNISVSKNFTANLPADFTGGLVNIETKDFPEQKFSKLSIGVGYNPSMHFNNDYLNYKGGKTDFLGFDDGTRALPANANTSDIPNPQNGSSPDEINQFVNGFNKTLGASRKTSLMDMSIGYSLGDQINLKGDKSKGNSIGYLFSISYKNSTDYYSDASYGEYQVNDSDPSSYELRKASSRTGEYGQNNVLIGLQGGLAFKTKLSKYKFTLMHIQNGASKAGKFRLYGNGDLPESNDVNGTSDNLEYNQRSLTNALLTGSHKTEDNKWEINWGTSYTLSIADDPDIRSTAFSFQDNGDTLFRTDNAGFPTRIWRSLKEYNLNAKVDFVRKHQLFGNDSKFLFGLNELYKNRDYNIIQLTNGFGSNQYWPIVDANEVLKDENIYPYLPNSVYYTTNIVSGRPSPNQYNANVNTFAFYVSEEAKISRRLKAILGVRAEHFVQRYTGGDRNGTLYLNNEEVLNKFDFFPSLNLIYALNEKQNLRGGFSRTTARPSFKELSYAQILDPITNRNFNGSFFQVPGEWDGNLVPTYVQNIDLRWELFLEKAQTVSFSAFYKSFTDAIELVRFYTSANDFQARNVGNASLYGFEFEFKKNFDFINEKLEKLSLSGNLTMLQSQIKMIDAEYEIRKTYEREGDDVKNTRQMAGQSPWVLNAGINYADNDNGFNAGLFYNVKGPTLAVVGNGLFPDVYTEPFHSLNLGLSKKIGKERNTTVKINVDNILNDRREMMYQSYEATNQPFSSINPGTAISLGASFKF